MAANADISSDNVADVAKTIGAVLDKVAVFNRVIDGIGEVSAFLTTLLYTTQKKLLVYRFIHMWKW